MPSAGVGTPLDILMLSPWLPWPPHDGARIRLLETLRFLSRRHKVFLLASLYAPEEEGHVRHIRELCDGVQVVSVADGIMARAGRLIRGLAAGVPPVQAYHRNPGMARSVRAITAKRRFDIIHVEFSFMAPYLAAVSPGCQAPKIMSMHNVESTRFTRELAVVPWNARRLALLADSYLFRNWEPEAVRAFDGVVVVSEEEKAWLHQHAPGVPVRLSPNGVDVEQFRPQPAARASAPTVVFTGAMHYPPNIDAAVWFADEILPGLRRRRPTLRFVIVGSRPVAEVLALASRPGIEVTGRVDDIRPYLAEATAVVVPLRSGGGTRLKILEAMAMARPVVSTTVGAEGLAVTDRHDILIADRPEPFAEAVLALAGSEELGARIGQAGRELVLARYDWQRSLQGLDDLYHAVLAGAP